MIRSSGNSPYAPRRHGVIAVKAGGGALTPANEPAAQEAPSPAMAVLQKSLGALWSTLGVLIGWLRSLFKPNALAVTGPQSSSSAASGTPTPGLPGKPVEAPLAPAPGAALLPGQMAGGVGFTQIAGRPAIGAHLEARTGDTFVTGTAAVTRAAEGLAATVDARVATPTMAADGALKVDAAGISGQGRIAGKMGDAHVLGTVAANSRMAAGGLTVMGPQVQGSVAGVVTKDTTLLAGELAARVGPDGSLRAAGLYQKDQEGVHANLQAAYRDPTTEAGLRYTQDNETHSAGGYLDRRLPHSSLSLGADYMRSPQGDGARAYGRWQSDAIGENVGGYAIKGTVEAGALKLPGQDWNTYATGRVTAEKENAALFAEIDHRAGPGFARPDTTLKFGAQFRF